MDLIYSSESVDEIGELDRNAYRDIGFAPPYHREAVQSLALRVRLRETRFPAESEARNVLVVVVREQNLSDADDRRLVLVELSRRVHVVKAARIVIFFRRN